MKPESVNIRSALSYEPQDFTPLLASNLNVLSVLEIGRLVQTQTVVALPGTNRLLAFLAGLHANLSQQFTN